LFRMLFVLRITFIDFIWKEFRIDTHRIKSTLWFWFSEINHNSMSCSNSWFGMFFMLQISFIDFIWNGFLIDVHQGPYLSR
jgi:hypothetical protein